MTRSRDIEPCRTEQAEQDGQTGRIRRGGARAACAALCAGGLVLAGAQVFPAAAQQPAADAHSRGDLGPAVTALVNSPTAKEQLRAFWTPERMRAATPLDVGAAQHADKEAAGPVERGETRTVRPHAADQRAADAAEFPESGGEWTGEGAVTKTTGRVFFTYDGRTASCSGSAVSSENKSTVVTAGHCVKMDDAWHTDWVFVPGYHDGKAPYGTWPASSTLTTPQWEESEDLDYDVGAAVVEPRDGERLTDVVGGQGLAFNSGYGADMYAFGYPAEDPYDGERLVHCAGSTFEDPLLTTDNGLNCDMTGGSSGGPWFADFDEKTGKGLQSSVNSFGYNFLPNTMFGPYFGTEAETLYDQAQATSAD